MTSLQESAGGVSLEETMDALILGYLSRRHYPQTCKAFLDESPSLNKKISEQWSEGTTDSTSNPPSIEITVHGKLLEEIVAMYTELGSFVAPPQFMQFGLKLRQLSSEFATLMGVGWSETQQQLYGRKTTLPTRTQPVSLAGGVRNVQTGPSNFTIVRESQVEAVSSVASSGFVSPEKNGPESRRRKAPPRHLANNNVMQSPLKEMMISQPSTSSFPQITFESFGALLDSGLADAVADGINRNLHGDTAETQSTTFCDFNAIVDDILSTDTDAVFKALNMASGSTLRGSDGGQWLSDGQLPDGSADEADLMHGWDPLQSGQESPMKIAQVIIDEMHEEEIVDQQPRQLQRTEELAGGNIPSVGLISASLPTSSSSSPCLLLPSLTDTVDAANRAPKPMKLNPSNSSNSRASDRPPVSIPSASTSKADVGAKMKMNKKERSASSSTTAPAVETVVSSATKKDKNKSSSIEAVDRRPMFESKKSGDKSSKEKRDRERDDERRKRDRSSQPAILSSNASSDKTKRPFGLNHVVTKRLYPDHQCASSQDIFANSDLFESESPKRKRPKENTEVFDTAPLRQKSLSKVESARRKLIDSMQEMTASSSPTHLGGKFKDKPRDDRRTSELSGERQRDVFTPDIGRAQRNRSRSPSVPQQTTTKVRSSSTSSKTDSRHKEKGISLHNKHGENRTPPKSIPQKTPTTSPTSGKGSTVSSRKKDKTPIPKCISSGVGKYRTIQLVGGSHSAKVGIVLEKAARARRQAEKEKEKEKEKQKEEGKEKEKFGPNSSVSSDPPSVPQTESALASTSSRLSPPIKNSPLKRRELPLDDAQLIDMTTNTPLTDTNDRDLIVLRMIDETAAASPSNAKAAPSPAMKSVSDLAAYCEQNCGFRLNLPASSPPKKAVRVDSARMESVLALLHGTKR